MGIQGASKPKEGPGEVSMITVPWCLTELMDSASITRIIHDLAGKTHIQPPKLKVLYVLPAGTQASSLQKMPTLLTLTWQESLLQPDIP